MSSANCSNERASVDNDLHDCFIATEASGSHLEGCNLTDALFHIAASLDGVAKAIRDLGNADAATPMGAMEAFGVVVKEGLQQLTEALDGIRNTMA